MGRPSGFVKDIRKQDNRKEHEIDRDPAGVYDWLTMTAYSVFDKLVARLSSTERQDMLQRIASSVTVAEPDDGPAIGPVIDLEESYRRMRLFRRLLIFLLAFFTGRERLSVVEGYLLRDLARRVASTIPHGFDTVQQAFRPGSLDDFRALSERARRFAGILARVMGRERRAFVSFLAGLHAPEVQERLVSDTDPFEIGAARPELKDADVKRRATGEVESITSTLSPQIRSRIYTDVRVLHQLMTLSAFPFDRLIGAFLPVSGGDPVPAPLSRVTDELARLAAVYDGMRPDPSAVLFEALGLYQNQDRLDEDDEAVEEVVRRQVESFAASYTEIREFGRTYLFSDLVRIAHSNLHYRPVAVGGGEDWFAQWKGFWRDRVDDAWRRYSYQRRVDAVVSTAVSTLGLSGAQPFPRYPRSGLDEPARHGLSMGVLRAVMGIFERELSVPIGALYRDGEFYKADNRTDMDRAWHAMQRLQTDVANLEVRLRPTGDLGMAWAQSGDETLPTEAARERQLALVATIDGDASAMIRRAVEAFHLVGQILEGVLYGSVGGRYDTIANLSELGGRSPGGFAKLLEEAHVRCKSAAGVLSDLLGVESSVEGA